MARVNALGTGYEQQDVDDIVRSPSPYPIRSNCADRRQLRTRNVQAIALPKTTSPEHIEWLVSRIEHFSPKHKQKGGGEVIKIIAMIENARGMINIERIAQAGEGYLDGLLVSTLLCVKANADY